ncbi:hypothetical protein SARC_04894 [Sphaeroforma arctica JP610]|uniref:Uncharacterized protein n=1 Tax=Sphaeroforma arctica JP610 TaxID=667725 RepID=A0A0L0G3P4_9EUKA|nr:hypothetical protein SARC_04894 [Sphaeroforma arctica JP610]KNC82828.1 hypothetical protein SARC_04894 [Sphaeroforma arctica JP610]|eukprot:XP_014156730.1 hypothetical protein SARC_04894 [Sphaeroforma arctica JP610]
MDKANTSRIPTADRSGEIGPDESSSLSDVVVKSSALDFDTASSSEEDILKWLRQNHARKYMDKVTTEKDCKRYGIVHPKLKQYIFHVYHECNDCEIKRIKHYGYAPLRSVSEDEPWRRVIIDLVELPMSANAKDKRRHGETFTRCEIMPHKMGVPYKPQTQGANEVRHRKMKVSMCGALLDDADMWPYSINWVQTQMNRTPDSVTGTSHYSELQRYSVLQVPFSKNSQDDHVLP